MIEICCFVTGVLGEARICPRWKMRKEFRSQGRPVRGVREVGRTRLLDKTRDALKMKPKIDMQRREIAKFVGVTPALVSYYFPNKWDLFAAAAKPVIEAYTAEVRAILHSDGVAKLKILSLTRLFIGFNFEHGYLLDFYLEHSARVARQDDLKQLHEIYEEMMVFFGDLLRDGLVRGESPGFIQSTLWGICKYVAQQPHLAGLADSPERDPVLQSQAERVCDLFLYGVATRDLFDSVDMETPA